jgi:peptidoglycan L-alanyl-D-glutamate endopeptidase CwlK
MYSLGKNTTKHLNSILKADNPKSYILIYAITEFIKITALDFCIISNGGYRTAKEQNALYKKGVSKCDGYDKISKHQLGLAVDLVPWVDGKPTWEAKYAYGLACSFMSFCNERNLPITSGADWNRDGNLKDGWDPCHMEINI